MAIFFVILSLLLLIFLCFRGIPIFFAAFLSGIFLLLTAGMDVTTSFTTTYITGLSGYFGKFFFIFTFGSLFGKLTDISGAADSIANTIVDRFGHRFVTPALVVAGMVLSYGGVSVFVCMFTLYPIMLSLFRKADIPRTLIPGVYFAGAGTAACWMPGSPQIQNLIPVQYLGTSTTAAFAPGMIGAVFETILIFLYIIWETKRAKTKGLHFELSQRDWEIIAMKEGKTLPNVWISLAPLVILLFALNFFRLPVEVALFTGVLAALLFYMRQIHWGRIWADLSDGTKDALGALFNTAAVVGFGTLVQATPAFQQIIEKVTVMNGNPLLISTVAIAVLAGVCGSGSGGLGIALPIIIKYFVPMGVNLDALTRISGLSCLTLDSLPHNGLVVSVLNVTGTDHKSAYFPVFMTTVAIPLVTLVFMFPVFLAFGMM